MSAPRVEVHEDRDALASAVAGELLMRLADAQEAGTVPHVALTGGGVAEVVHREVARLSTVATADRAVDWSRVVIWWGDERFVAPDSEDRNALPARRELLDVVGADPAHVHEMPSTATAPDVEAGAASYADELAAHGGGDFEIVMLGIGPDGHIASLFPGHPQLDVDDRLTVAVTGSPKPPPERISLTLAAINRARSVWFVVSGDEKSEAAARALADGTDLHEVPAAGVSGREETIWFLDRAAASRL